jgi:CubicO group peptidase (beta-lactamase class C family)
MNTSRLVDTLNASVIQQAFSGVISIRKSGTVLYERASGFADRSNQIPNTPETRFGIASGTKFLTALATGRLILDGKLSFSTRLRDCLPLDFPRYDP